MKVLFIFLIFIQFCFNKNLLDKFINYIDNLIEKKKFKAFIKDIDEKVEYFTKMANRGQSIILKHLNNTMQTVIEKINNEHKNIQTIKTFVKTAIGTIKYLTIYDCNKDVNPLKCKNDKKEIFFKLFRTINNEFQCSTIITQMLSINVKEYINYILYLIQSITKNKSFLVQYKIQILYDIINCLQEKLLGKYWPLVKKHLKLRDNKIIEFKKNSLKILIESIYNLIKFQKEKKSIIIYKIMKSFFILAKELNEFGSDIYKIDDSLSINVIINQGKLDKSKDKELFVYKLNNKEIKVIINSNYIFKEKGAHSIHIILFNTSFNISNDLNIIVNDSYNPSVLINLYDKDGKEINLNNISDNFRPQILYNKKSYTNIKECLNYNESYEIVNENDNYLTNYYNDLNGEIYINCIPKNYNSFILNYSEQNNISSSNLGYNKIKILVICLFILIFICFCIICYKSNSSEKNYIPIYSRISKSNNN